MMKSCSDQDVPMYKPKLLTVFKIVVRGRVTLKYLFKGLIFDKLYY